MKQISVTVFCITTNVIESLDTKIRQTRPTTIHSLEIRKSDWKKPEKSRAKGKKKKLNTSCNASCAALSKIPLIRGNSRRITPLLNSEGLARSSLRKSGNFHKSREILSGGKKFGESSKETSRVFRPGNCRKHAISFHPSVSFNRERIYSRILLILGIPFQLVILFS